MSQVPSTVEPTHVVALTETWRVQAVAYSPDGAVLYVLHEDLALSLWAIGVHFWPWILGFCLAILTLACAVACVRILRRPQLAGHPHCRRCNYDLVGATDGPCAECGTDPTRSRPKVGKSRRRRAAPWMISLALAGAAYGALFLAGPRWEHWAASLVRWDSKLALDAALDGRAPWLSDYAAYRASVSAFVCLAISHAERGAIRHLPRGVRSVNEQGRGTWPRPLKLPDHNGFKRAQKSAQRSFVC